MSIEHVCRITSSNYNSIISVPSAVPSSAGSSSSSSSPLFQTVSNNANGTTSIEVHPASSISSSSSSYTAAESLRKQLPGVDYSLSADSKTKSEMAKLLRLLSDSLESDMGGEGAALRATEETTRELLHVDVETMEVEMAKNIVSSGGEDMHSETASTAHSSAVHSSESQPNSDSPALHYASSSSVEQHQHHQTGVQLAEEEPSAVVRMEEDGPTTNGDIGFDSRKTTETENNNFESASSLLFPAERSNNDEMAASLEQQLSIQTEDRSGEKIFKDASFPNYEDFIRVFEEWKSKYNHPFRVASSEAFRDPDGNINEEFRYKYIVYQCAHYGEPRKRGNGRRPKQNYLPCGCRAKLRLNYKSNKMVVTTLRTEHNHEDRPIDFYLKSPKIKKESPSNLEDSHCSIGRSSTEWINSEGSPNSVTSKNGSFFACDSSSFISPISNHTTSLFSPPGSTFLQQHSPNLKALDASANLPKSSQSAGGGLSNFGGFENFLASSFNTHSNNNNAQSVPPYEVIKEQLLAILQYQQKAKAQQEQHQQQQSCLSQLIDSVKSETPFVNKLITKQDANKPTRSNEFNPSLPLPPSTPATTRSAASSQFQFPQQYLPIIQGLLDNQNSLQQRSQQQQSKQQAIPNNVNTTGSANIFSSLFGNLPQQQQQQHNQQFSSAVGSHNQPFSQSTTFESLLCNDVKSQQQSFNMPQQNLQTSFSTNKQMFNDLLGEQLQQCQLALLQQNLNSGNPLQTLIRKQMVSTNLPINQQLTALQNSYFALFLNNDPMVDAARLLGILVDQIRHTKDVRGYLARLGQFLDS